VWPYGVKDIGKRGNQFEASNRAVIAILDKIGLQTRLGQAIYVEIGAYKNFALMYANVLKIEIDARVDRFPGAVLPPKHYAFIADAVGEPIRTHRNRVQIGVAR
jgi:hypothetical protein